MGKANIAVFSEDENTEIVGAIENDGSKYLGDDAGSVAGIENIGIPITSDIEKIIRNSDVVVDFTECSASIHTLHIAEKYKKAVVIGTTGFNQEQITKIKKIAKNIPVLLSSNMSIGVTILLYLVKRATELLGDNFDAEIVEIHHNQKKDAPSGTALQFGQVIAEARGKTLDSTAVYERHGLIGKRKKGEIGIMALRVSDIVGEHTIIFGGPGERIEFSHKNSSRRTYASGALRAAHFIAQKKNGFFSISDALGL